VRATRPTMRDVAGRAGVSLKTVSRVINGEPGVAPETSARVTAAIGALGFQRNDLARSLRQGRSTATLGLIIEDFANPFYSLVAQAVEAVAEARGFLLISGSCAEDPERERELAAALLRRRVDAVLIVPAGEDHSYLVGELGAGTPAVFLDRPPRGITADAVLFDDAGGARRAVEHLVAHGHRRIACLADAEVVYTARERRAGYVAALAAAGLAPDPALMPPGQRDAAAAEAAVGALLDLPPDRRPTALFCANNRNTIGALRALRGRAEGIALVGFDDFELADVLAVPVTVVRSDPYRLGTTGAELAFGRLDGEDGPAQRVVLPVELVPRGSGELAP
jgi:LacI family transcriptional regulator